MIRLTVELHSQRGDVFALTCNLHIPLCTSPFSCQPPFLLYFVPVWPFLSMPSIVSRIKKQLIYTNSYNKEADNDKCTVRLPTYLGNKVRIDSLLT
jgi:hypothetical protein